MPTYVETWDETKPAGSRARSLGDDDIREFKRALRERLATDHDIRADESGITTIGYHKQVTLIEAANIGTGANGLPILGAQTVSGKPELVYTDEDNNDIQLTDAGKINAHQASRKLYTGGDFLSSSASFGDIDAVNAAITITTGARAVLIGFGGTLLNSVGAGTFYIDIAIDGTRQGGTNGLYEHSIDTANIRVGVGYVYQSAVLSAGSHTFKLQWRVSGGTINWYANSSVPFHMWVEELK